jgi:hypothetical protein
MIAGTISLHRNAILEVVGGMLSETSLDFCVTQNTFSVSKSLGTKGIDIFGVFTLDSFLLSADPQGFALGGSATLTADWLSKGQPQV